MNVNILIFFLFTLDTNSQTHNGKIIRIICGDTIEEILDKTMVKIRVGGGACPKYYQDCVLDATEFTYNFSFNKNLIILEKEFDRHGRIVATIKLLDSIDLSESLLRKGLAWHYKKYDHSIKLPELENIVRKQKRGIWLN